MNGDYQIEVRDFGPIAQASVDVRPLTVFIGPSNTGKSYLATLIYALHRSFNGSRYLGRIFGHSTYSLPAPSAAIDELSASVKDWLIMQSQPAYAEARIPADFVEVVRPALADPTGLAEHIHGQLLHYFGPTSELVRESSASSHAELAMAVPHGESQETLRYRFQFGNQDQESRLSADVPEFGTVQMDQRYQRELRHIVQFTNEKGSQRFTLHLLFDLVFRSILHPLCRNAYYLPTDRPGLMQSHHVIVSSIVQQASMAGIRRQPDIPMLSGVLADFLDQLLQIDQRPQFGQRRRARLDEHLEGLLDGEIRLDQSTHYPSISYRPKDWRRDLPLSRASSMISELAPVVLFLRHVVRSDDVIIIDEPESHLHPEMQAKFTRELARLVRTGVRVVMTTHSEWVLEAIGNLVLASGLAQDRRAGLDSAGVTLKPEQVGAWLFNHEDEQMGAVVKEIELNRDTGLYSADFEEVSRALYNESATIFNRLQEDAE